MNRIPVKLVRIGDDIEVSMDIDDFESSDLGVTDDIQELKNSYNNMMRVVKPVLDGKPSTTERWRACRMMADLADGCGRFVITNFTSACSRDMKSGANIPLLIRFGREFSEGDIHDSIPFTQYRRLVLKKSEFIRQGIYEFEKTKLVDM